MKLMLIELSTILENPLYSAERIRLGRIDRAVIDGKTGRIAGFQVQQLGLIKKFSGLNFMDVLDISRQAVVVDDIKSLNKDLKDFDMVLKNFGPVLNIKAKTESGKGLGKISDLLVDAESGLIVRFYLKNLLTERIIPREYLVSITPKQIIFKDVVDQPIFDSLATQSMQAE